MAGYSAVTPVGHTVELILMARSSDFRACRVETFNTDMLFHCCDAARGSSGAGVYEIRNPLDMLLAYFRETATCTSMIRQVGVQQGVLFIITSEGCTWRITTPSCASTRTKFCKYVVG